MPDAPVEYLPARVPTRFEVAMDVERGRWLRRRFIAYCIISLCFGGLSLIRSLFDDPDEASWWLDGYLILSLLGTAAVLLFTFRQPPRTRTMLRLAMWLYIITNVAALAVNRINFESVATRQSVGASFPIGARTLPYDAPREGVPWRATVRHDGPVAAARADLAVAAESLERASEALRTAPPLESAAEWGDRAEALRAGAEELEASLAEVDPSGAAMPWIAAPPPPRSPVVVSPVSPVADISSKWRAIFSATWAVGTVLFFSHLVACLILPWTFRESLFPGLVVFNGYLLILILDLALSGLPWWLALIFLVGGLAALVPGSLWCFWRYTRFPKWFRTRYEADRYQQLSRDLSGARMIHESVLPPQKEQGAVRLSYVYEPMSQIGGDLLYVRHDREEDPDSPLNAVLLDVTGHGIAAALTVNRLLGELDRLFGEQANTPPGVVLKALNHYVHVALVRHGVFVTAVALRLEPHEGDNLCYANAGHPPAFARRGDRCERLEPTTFMLGVMDDNGFDPNEQCLHLDRGDAVLVYTDGAAEARDDRGRQIGTMGLEHLFREMRQQVPPHQWPQHVLGHVARHRNKPPDDDTLIAAVYRP